MFPTNIHNPVALLSRAGNDGTVEDQAHLIVSGPV